MRFHPFRTLPFAGAALAAVLMIPSGISRPASKVKPFSAYDSQAKALLAKMTLDEKIGQMTQADLRGLKDLRDVQKYYLGSVLSGGNSDPKSGNTLQDWTDTVEQVTAEAMKTRLAIPLLYGIDAVHGHNNILGATIFPHNIGEGCAHNPELVMKAARITAEEVRATGINWAFGPCVTVPQDIRWGRTYEGYGETPEMPALLGRAAVMGFQGQDLASPLSVLACAKHYVGDGGTTMGTGLNHGLDQGDTRVDEATLRKIHMQGYVAAVRAGVGSIMPSYSSWNGTKCSASKRLLTDILKNELGFEGFLISDYNALDELPGDRKQQIETSINAGMDMVMVPDKYREFYDTLKELVNEGKVPMSRIDDAVTRILRVKFAMGLMAKGYSPLADRRLWKTFGSPEHRAVARELVRQSIVLLKNDHKTLPISKTVARIHVAGKSADDMGNQCGGWTITWQGASGNVTPGGTTILAAIRNTVSKNTKVTFSRDGTGAEGASLGIVVVGETPYAEMLGDRTDLTLAPEDVTAINNMKSAGIPVVVILISGRPMIIKDVLDKADAFLAAWLPGTEGQGVADVLFGNYKPTGKLTFSWPRTMAQVPIHVGSPHYNPLFRYGYGLTY
ncbi:MAG TPA: glycoside hydrolase family 3 N-terminal domain-containing protein [Terriglobia bacterium]|nr:glycoside hydrolase family 3 N-terminal domain-containing protein [Terriglobia bacterium]